MPPVRYESADDLLRKRVIALFVITFPHMNLSDYVFVIIKYVLIASNRGLIS